MKKLIFFVCLIKAACIYGGYIWIQKEKRQAQTRISLAFEKQYWNGYNEGYKKGQYYGIRQCDDLVANLDEGRY